MAHGITQFDNGMVGFVEVYGGTWHQLPQYRQVDGEIPFEDVRKTLEYEVVKIPLAFHIPESQVALREKMPDGHGKLAALPDMSDGGDSRATGNQMFALVRTDFGIPVHGQSVTDEYEIFPNEMFLDNIQNQLLSKYPELKVESCGSLWGGRVSFLNILLSRFAIKGDSSETVSRLMFWNAFGGRSISGCGHNTRVVCNNTSMMAEAQGEMNKTLKKFKHTSGAPKRVVDHLIDLARMQAILESHKAAMSHFAEIQMSVKDVDNFLGNYFPIAVEASDKAATRRTNNRMELNEVFEATPDLQGGIARSRYAMYQAVVDYNQHRTLSKDADATFTWWNAATGGNRHEANQKAYSLLTQTDIPEPPKIEKESLLTVGVN
jgi:hypothetical protein